MIIKNYTKIAATLLAGLASLAAQGGPDEQATSIEKDFPEIVSKLKVITGVSPWKREIAYSMTTYGEQERDEFLHIRVMGLKKAHAARYYADQSRLLVRADDQTILVMPGKTSDASKTDLGLRKDQDGHRFTLTPKEREMFSLLNTEVFKDDGFPRSEVGYLLKRKALLRDAQFSVARCVDGATDGDLDLIITVRLVRPDYHDSKDGWGRMGSVSGMIKTTD